MRYLKLVMGVVLLTACTSSKETRLQQFLLKGNIALQEGNFDKAEYYYGRCLE